MPFASANQLRATGSRMMPSASRTHSVAQLTATGAPLPPPDLPALPEDAESMAALAKALLAYVTLATAQTITGLKTFNRGAAAPFAVDAASLLVANLNADKLDGFDESAFGKLADAESVTGVWDFVNGLKLGSHETVVGYDEDTFTITGVGFSVNPTGTARYFLFGKLVGLYIPTLSGTSNTTSFSLSGIPAGITPTRTSDHLVFIQDNTVQATGVLEISSGSLIVGTLVPGNAFTASGTKTLYNCWVFYALL